MGNKSSIQKEEEIFTEEYEELKTEFNERYGEVKIFKKKASPQIKVLTKEIWFENQQKYEEFIFKVKKRKNIYSDNIAALKLAISKKILFKIK